MIYSYNKTKEMPLISQIYFLNRTPCVSDRVFVHHLESSTVYTAILVGIYVIQILLTAASSQQNLYDIYLLLCIQYYTPDDGQKTCPKHVISISKINLRN